MSSIKELLSTLIEFESVTPHDTGCQDFMIDYLSSYGFKCRKFDNPPVSNFFARLGESSPLLIFAGHTDVVPAGNLNEWTTSPFLLHEDERFYYGRGTADMKGSLAAMMHAAAQFALSNPAFKGSLGFLITSGEEGDHFDLGTPYVMAQLKTLGIHPNYCIVGEPSSTAQIGDVIKIGRRGSLTGKILLKGKQGHVAYPHLADNPIHKIIPVLEKLAATVWDRGNAFFPPTSFQITSIKAGGDAGNIIPGDIQVQFNLRYCSEQTANDLKAKITEFFTSALLEPLIEWKLNGEPFLTCEGQLLNYCVKAIQIHTERTPELSTSGGTSDGRFIAPYQVETLEFGPVNATIHQINERVAKKDLETLGKIYLSLCTMLLT